MFPRNSLMGRIGIAKLVGFVMGLVAFFALPLIVPGTEPMLRWGMLFWYTMIGAFVGLFGVFDWHPMLRWRMPWWFRGAFLGAWLNFVLTLFIHEELAAMMMAIFGEDGALQSPFWFVVDGAIAGFIIDWIATRWAGEGPQIAVNDQAGRIE